MITKLTENVPAREYHQWPGVSPSRAKYALESALAYKHACEVSIEPTDEMDLGTACHLAVWEPDLLPLRCVVWDGGIRRGKTWDQFCEANAGKLILTTSAYTTAMKVRDRCNNHPAIKTIMEYVKRGTTELSMQWEESGLQCRGRVDFVYDRIYDLKTAFNISDRSCVRSVIDRCYHMQGAAYQNGYAATAGEVKDFVLIFAQTKPPYDARVLIVEGAEMERGQKLWALALSRIAEAIATNTYPGIDENESPLILPEWALDNGDELSLTLDGESIGL